MITKGNKPSLKFLVIIISIIILAILSVILFRYVAEVYPIIFIVCLLALAIAYPFSLHYPSSKR